MITRRLFAAALLLALRTQAPAQTCQPALTPCTSGAQCCSGVCANQHGTMQCTGVNRATTTTTTSLPSTTVTTSSSTSTSSSSSTSSSTSTTDTSTTAIATTTTSSSTTDTSTTVIATTTTTSSTSDTSTTVTTTTTTTVADSTTVTTTTTVDTSTTVTTTIVAGTTTTTACQPVLTPCTSAAQCCSGICSNQHGTMQCAGASRGTTTTSTSLPPTTVTSTTSTTSTTVFGATTSTTLYVFRCTLGLGFSQTRQWWVAGSGGAFETVVNNDLWEMRESAGAGVEWQDPNFVGWTSPILSPCTDQSIIDRVLLTISTSNGFPAVDWWVQQIRAEVATIRVMLPDVRQIILQPLVGGPNHMICGTLSNPNHPSIIHPRIDEAIAIVAQDAPDLVVGYSPEVDSCADFTDWAGHLTNDARIRVGRKIGLYYLGAGF